MDEIKAGCIVYSKCGHDEGVPYLVLGASSVKNYLFVTDGDKRKVLSPKQKNPKHLKYKGEFSAEAIELINSGELKDCEVVSLLKPYRF